MLKGDSHVSSKHRLLLVDKISFNAVIKIRKYGKIQMKICIHETETVKSVIVILLNSMIQNVFDKK